MENGVNEYQHKNIEKILYVFGGLLFIIAFISTMIFSSNFSPITVLQVRLSFVATALIYFITIHFYYQRIRKIEAVQINVNKNNADVFYESEDDILDVQNNNEIVLSEVKNENNDHLPILEASTIIIDGKIDEENFKILDADELKQDDLNDNRHEHEVTSNTNMNSDQFNEVIAIGTNQKRDSSQQQIEIDEKEQQTSKQFPINHSQKENLSVLASTIQKVSKKQEIVDYKQAQLLPSSDTKNENSVEPNKASSPRHTKYTVRFNKNENNNERKQIQKKQVVKSKNDQITIWFNGSLIKKGSDPQ